MNVTDEMIEAAASLLNKRLASGVGLHGVSRDMLETALSLAPQVKETAAPEMRMRGLLEEVLTVLDGYADPTGYTDRYGDPLPADAELHEGLLAKATAERIRAALATTKGK